jgi:hypothetical protein
MMGKSLRKQRGREGEKERERERQTDRQIWGAAQGNLFLTSPQQGVSPSRSIQQGAGGSRSHLRQNLAGFVLSYTNIGPGEVSLCGCQKCYMLV